jgi:predicted RNase H-like HicB family nuclease
LNERYLSSTALHPPGTSRGDQENQDIMQKACYNLNNSILKEVFYMRLKIILEPSEDGGYTAIVPALPGCISEGNTRKEALDNIKEAIELYLDPVDDDLSFAPNSKLVELTV